MAAAAVFAVWVANRKRIAAETIGRAEEQALRIVKDAERDAETRKKEALLEAKEKAHEILMRRRAPGAPGPPAGADARADAGPPRSGARRAAGRRSSGSTRS